jgi:hypothetical protein
MTLEDDAEAFKRKREAEKKARQRAGLRCRTIVVHDETCIPTLVAMGFLRDADIEADAAINEAFAAFIRHYCHNVRYSKQTGWEARNAIWREEDEASGRRAKREEQDRRHVKRLDTGGFSDGGIHPDHEKPMPFVRRRGDNRPIEVSDLPRWKVDRKRGGTPSGRNPMLTTATIYNARGMVLGKYKAKPLPGSDGETIKPLSAKKIRETEKEIERKHGRLVPPDKSVHTVASNKGEVDCKLDKLSAGELRWAKRVVTQEYDRSDDKDDPATYS